MKPLLSGRGHLKSTWDDNFYCYQPVLNGHLGCLPFTWVNRSVYGLSKVTRISVWNISSGKTGLPFQMFRFSRKFSVGKTQKVVFHLLTNRISRKILVSGKQHWNQITPPTMPDTGNAKDCLELPPTTFSIFTLKNVTWRTYLIRFTVQYYFLFCFVCIELVLLIWFLQI